MTDIDLTAAKNAAREALETTTTWSPMHCVDVIVDAALPHDPRPHERIGGRPMSDYECCASGSCEVCRRPTGYTQRQREEIRDYEPPWMRQHDREGWNR